MRKFSRPGLPHDRADGRRIVVLDAASQRVGQQLFGEGADEQFRPAQQRRFESVDIREPAAVGKPAGRVDRRPGFDRSPAADRVELLERQAERIHQVVARGADRRCSRCSASRSRTDEVAVHGVVLQRRHVGQRRRRRDAEKIVEDELAAQDRRGPGRIRRDRQDASLTKQSAAPAVLVERDAPEAAAIHVRDAVMLRQPLVDERVVRAQQIEHAAILAQDALEEELRLLVGRPAGDCRRSPETGACPA